MSFGICTTRGMSFEPKSAIASREKAKADLRKIRDEEERAYREHLPQQIKQARRDKRRNRKGDELLRAARELGIDLSSR